MIVNGVDLTNVKKPVLPKKPVKPIKPLYVDKTEEKRKILWQTTSETKDFKLVDVLKQALPDNVPVENLYIWADIKSVSTYYDYDRKPHIKIGTIDTVPTTAWVKYQEKLAKYEKDLEDYNKIKSTYDKDLEKYNKVKKAADAIAAKAALKKSLTSLTAKMDQALN